MIEMWQDVKGYEGLYQVSNCGKVYSHYRGGRVLKSWTNKHGYEVLTLNHKGIKKEYKMHRLVALHFLKRGGEAKEVNHIDGCKTNNRLDNLEWCTRSENMVHAFKKGLATHKGSNHPRTTLTEDKVLSIRNHLGKGVTVNEVAKMYEVRANTIYAIKYRKTWKHIK